MCVRWDEMGWSGMGWDGTVFLYEEPESLIVLVYIFINVTRVAQS